MIRRKKEQQKAYQSVLLLHQGDRLAVVTQPNSRMRAGGTTANHDDIALNVIALGA